MLFILFRNGEIFMVDWWEDGAIIVCGRVSVTTIDHSFNWIFFKDWIRSHSFGSL